MNRQVRTSKRVSDALNAWKYIVTNRFDFSCYLLEILTKMNSGRMQVDNYYRLPKLSVSCLAILFFFYYNGLRRKILLKMRSGIGCAVLSGHCF